MHMRKKSAAVMALVLSFAILLSSCSFNPIQGLVNMLTDDSATNASTSTATPVRPNEPNSDASGPEVDFYEYVNYDWLQETQLSQYVPQVDQFSALSSEVYTELYFTLRYALSDGSVDINDGSDIAKLVKYFATSLDFDSRNDQGAAPAKPYIDKIKGISSIEEVQQVATDMDIDGLGTFMMFTIRADMKDSLTNRLYLSGPMLSLGEKSYYSGDSEFSQMMIKAYLDYLENILFLAGESSADAKAIAEDAFQFEKALAESTLSLRESNEVENIYNIYDLAEFDAQLENFRVADFLERVGLVDPEFIIVQEVEYYRTLDQLMVEDNLETIKNFMYVQLLSQVGDYLSMDFVRAGRDFVNTVNGTSGYRDEDEIAFFSTEATLGEIMSRIYIDANFSASAKEEVTTMVHAIIDNYKIRISELDWMGDETKAEAIKKLDNMNLKIGYPDEWTDHSSLVVSTYEEGGNVLQNYVNSYHFSYRSFTESLDQPVDKTSWGMTAHTPNAYYSPSNNEIVFPAAILQEPFYSEDWTDSRNHGAIGAIIAHEISHAFDNSGRKFDENGNQENWWTDEDLTNYEERTQSLIDLFDSVEVLPGYYVDGELTLDENIADLGGISCIVDVVKNLPDGDLNETFEAYAYIWAAKSTDELTLQLLTEDTHSPNKYRVNTILPNLADFYEVYGIQEGDPMYLAPENRIRIW